MDLLEHSWTFLEPLILYTSSLARFPRSATSWLFRHRTALCAELLTPGLCPLRLLLPGCCCSQLVSAHTLQLLSVPDFNSSPIVSTLGAPPRLRPIQLLLLDCVHFNCSSPIASTLTATPRLHPLVASPVLEDSSPCPMFSNFLRRVRGSVNNWSTKVARHQSSPTPRTSHKRHSLTHTHTR